jgi:hypothetical protein
MTAGDAKRNDPLGVVAAQHLRSRTIDSGTPTGHPGVGDDQQTRRVGCNTQNQSVRITANPLDRRKGLPRVLFNIAKGIEFHQNRPAGIDPKKLAGIDPFVRRSNHRRWNDIGKR